MKKWLLISAFLIGCFSFGLVKAAPNPLYFDSYTAGVTSSWPYPFDVTKEFYATDTISASQPNSITNSQGAFFNLPLSTSSLAGQLSFSFYINHYIGNPAETEINIPFNDGFFFINYDGIKVSVWKQFPTIQTVIPVSADAWHTFDLTWDVALKQYTLKIDGTTVINKEPFYHDIVPENITGSGPAFYQIWFDNLSYPNQPGPSFSFDFPSINIEYPYPCQQNKVATTTNGLSFYITGNVTNPPKAFYASSTVLSNVQAHFWTTNMEEATTVTLYAGDIDPNSAASFHVPVTLPVGSYQVTYTADGFNDNIGVTPVSLDKCRTFVTDNYLNATQIGAWGEPCAGIYEDCVASSTSITDKILCAMERVGLALVCPSRATLTKAIGIKDDIAGRFPVSLFTAAGALADELKNPALYATSSATTTLFAQDISPLGKLSQLTLFVTIRNITIMLIWGLAGFAAFKLLMKFGFIK